MLSPGLVSFFFQLNSEFISFLGRKSQVRFSSDHIFWLAENIPFFSGIFFLPWKADLLMVRWLANIAFLI